MWVLWEAMNCREGLLSLYPWRSSRPDWPCSWATCSRWPYFEQRGWTRWLPDVFVNQRFYDNDLEDFSSSPLCVWPCQRPFRKLNVILVAFLSFDTFLVFLKNFKGSDTCWGRRSLPTSNSVMLGSLWVLNLGHIWDTFSPVKKDSSRLN